MRIETERGPVSGAWLWPEGVRLVCVVAHGAGKGMESPLLVGFARGLADAGVATLRFNFPYKEQGRQAPDPAPVLMDAYRAAFEHARSRARKLPVFVGGKSLGGRIASLLVAEGLPAAGLFFLGYPLHPPGRPERLRDEHLDRITVPMLFMQGTADPFARFDLLEKVVARLGEDRAVLFPVEGGDHSLRVRARRRPEGDIGRDLGHVAASLMLNMLIDLGLVE